MFKKKKIRKYILITIPMCFVDSFAVALITRSFGRCTVNFSNKLESSQFFPDKLEPNNQRSSARKM